MTKYLFLILMLISPGEGAVVKRKPVDQLPRLIGSPTPDGLESGGLSLDLPGDDEFTRLTDFQPFIKSIRLYSDGMTLL